MNAAGIGREHHDPRGKKDSFRNRVRHKNSGPFLLVSQAQQLFI